METVLTAPEKKALLRTACAHRLSAGRTTGNDCRSDLYENAAKFLRLSRPAIVPINWALVYTTRAMNILVVDDDDGCSQLLRDLLAQEPDCNTVFASNGAEAWWMLSDPERRFDLGIFDIRMPVVDGISLLKRIRETPKLNELRIILCTGINERKTVHEAAQYIVQHYIVKPYSGRAMLDKIRQVAQSVPQPRPAGINLVST